MDIPKSNLKLLEPVLDEFASVQGNLITILQKAQEIYGYLPKDVIYHIAEKTGNTPAEVMGVATFYSQFRLEPLGKYLVMICQGTACHVNGSEKVFAAVSEYLGVESGKTTADGLFTFEKVEHCIEHNHHYDGKYSYFYLSFHFSIFFLFDYFFAVLFSLMRRAASASEICSSPS